MSSLTKEKIGIISKVKNAILAMKQGEALERDTHPLTLEEGVGLGFFGAPTVLALGIIQDYENVLNDLCNIDPKDALHNNLHEFTRLLGVASGSRESKRLTGSLETIGQLGQPMSWPTRTVPRPETFGDPE